MTLDKNILLELRDKHVLENIDLYFADFLLERKKSAKQNDIIFYLATILVNWALRQGHSCLDINAISNQSFPPKLTSENIPEFKLPSVEEFTKALVDDNYSNSILVLTSEIDANTMATCCKPLIFNLESKHLYLNKYYEYESNILERIIELAALPVKVPNNVGRCKSISSLLNTNNGTVNYQQLAVFISKVNQFSIITGGPGTGKTTVMTSLLAWELEENPNLRIAIVAPTGKAQQRMQESIREEIENLDCGDSIKDSLRLLPCSTIHSLLKVNYSDGSFRYNSSNLLPYDMLVVDEVSMVSLSLMSHLLDALSDKTKLVLIGDKDQLSSVDSGSVLSDIYQLTKSNSLSKELKDLFLEEVSLSGNLIDIADENNFLSGHVGELQENYRSKFAPVVVGISNRIKGLPDEIPNEDLDNLTEIITNPNTQNIQSIVPKSIDVNEDLLNQYTYKTIVDGQLPEKEISAFLSEKSYQVFSLLDLPSIVAKGTLEDYKLAFKVLESVRVLCAVKEGPFGVYAINDYIKKLLKINSTNPYGLAIMVLSNLPSLNLFNGDVGLIVPKCPKEELDVDSSSEQLDAENNIEQQDVNNEVKEDKYSSFVVFQATDGSLKFYKLAEIPLYEDAFAMTIHKSQGSGFNNVMLVMPDKEVAILTRELIYTGITRTKNKLVILSKENIIRKSLVQKTFRYSGLQNRYNARLQTNNLV